MSTENLSNQDAIDKLSDMINDIDICMFSAFPNQLFYPHTVPMSRQEVDESGNIWFLFSSESELHQFIESNSKVSLSFSDVGSYKFLSINGIATITRDQDRIAKYWNKFVEAWFDKGKEDPNIRILKVVPKEAYYWDNKTNKLMTLLKVATSAISGEKMDLGKEGSLEI
ncbi:MULTISPECIES: pyridoxamine 5'-phosphate oxidase family protein [Empedobacter]|uniref:pyridoxamine 5'-phosphate oxidase family protein n=1 Tax=Empedobacter TaxID=59734 RepID=UPI00289EEDEF|nr:pyridoxamine 5'-phosphate oxidase family protein [Empedobacter sp.]